jgi:hypothetical protein
VTREREGGAMSKGKRQVRPEKMPTSLIHEGHELGVEWLSEEEVVRMICD